MSVGLRNTLAGRVIVEELVRCGVTELIVAPGSRNTPLADAAARHPRVGLHVVVDERSAAFMAIGLGRATRRPAALITTSGSAAGHALPALIEADAARIPLLIISADRPPELRDTGANQTIDQVQLFGGRVRLFAELPCPDDAVPVRALLTRIDQAVAAAMDGPVHLNAPFRKPLDPTGPDGLAGLVTAGAPAEAATPALRRWLEGQQPFTRWPGGLRQPAGDGLRWLREALAQADVGVVVAGTIDDPAERAAAVALTGHLGWPVVADITSGLRMGGAVANLLPHQDLLLGAKGWADATRPDTVLRIGGPLVSRRVQAWLDAAAPTHHIVVRPDLRRFDPGHGVTLRLDSHIAGVCAAMAGAWPRPRAALAARMRRWHAIGQEVAAGLPALPGDEIAVARGICAALPAGAGLWAASSMSVRLLDTFAPADGPPIAVAASRGASGIDGLIAQATGWSLARVTPSVLLIGDLAALHDLGSLRLLAAEQPNLVVVVVNNDGGGIFSLLPIRTESAHFEAVFAASHGERLVPWAHAAGLQTVSVGDVAELPGVLAQAIAAGGPHVVEVHTEREAARLAWTHARDTVAAWAERLLAGTP